MSTLVAAPAKPSLALRGLAYVVSAAKTLLEIFGEAQHQAALARKRPPFIVE